MDLHGFFVCLFCFNLIFCFYKKLGSALNTKSLLVSLEGWVVSAVKCSGLVSYFLGPKNCVLVRS